MADDWPLRVIWSLWIMIPSVDCFLSRRCLLMFDKFTTLVLLDYKFAL